MTESTGRARRHSGWCARPRLSPPELIIFTVLAVLVVGLGVIVAVAVGTVRDTERAVTHAEARMVASLWEVGGRDAVIDLVGERALITTLDRSTARSVDQRRDLDGRGAAVALAYAPGSLTPEARINVVPMDEGSRGWPNGPVALALVALVLAVCAIGRTRFMHGIGITLSAHRPIHRLAFIAFAGIFLGAGVGAKAWTDGKQIRLSALHAERAASGVAIALELGADPLSAARIADLPWMHADDLARPETVWTMPRSVATVLATTTVDALRGARGDARIETISVDGATYHARSAGPIRLVLLGHEEDNSATVPLTVAAGAGWLASALVLSLLPLAHRRRKLRRTLTAWAFLAPSAVLLAVFTFGPLGYSLWISLHDWHLVDTVHPFVGLGNFRELVRDGDWWSSVRNTAVFTLHVPIAMAAALALALLTQGSRRAVSAVRLALFLPALTSVAAIAIAWKWLLNDQGGAVNRVLGSLGISVPAWLSSPDLALVSLMMIGVWMVVGYQMVVFQAGLAAIPADLHDAARVDGAGGLRRLVQVTLPCLRHTLFFVLVTSVIGSFQIFGLVYVMTEGGPLGSTNVAVYHIYREAWEFLRFGDAAAMSWLLFAIIFIATWLHFRFLERRTARA